MDLIKQYIIALTNLYGIVNKAKVVEIYNMQNEVKITEKDLLMVSTNVLEKGFVSIHRDYFVNDSILEFDEFDLMMAKKGDKPYYIPPKEDLLKYVENGYFEVNKQYSKLVEYVKKSFFNDDQKAEWFCEDIYGTCQYDFDIQSVIQTFNDKKINFKDEKEANKVLQLVMELANNVRIWENNGHTPNEIFKKFEKPNLKPLPNKPFDFNKTNVFDIRTKKKIGRNDPCPCGSGKKYKKCCLGKDELNH